jgi:hypothetical protein
MTEGKWLLLVIVISAAAIVAIMSIALEEEARLKQQCLDDGRREYECAAMLRGTHR